MTASKKLRMSLSRRGDTIHLRVRNGGRPLTAEQQIQLQILEYEITNTSHSDEMQEDREIEL